jgi:hypothetical protein
LPPWRALRECLLHHVALLAEPGEYSHRAYASRYGVRDNFAELPDALPHWPGRLREGGYATAYLGK